MNDTKVNNRLTTGELFDSWDGVHLNSGIQVLVLIVYKAKVGVYLDYDRLTALAAKVGKIKHYNILSYHKIVQNDVQIGITMEFPNGPPIRDFLMGKHDKRLNEIEARGLFKQMIDGIDYLHSKKIVHRTLNFFNVYVTQGGVVKIGDYLISTKSSSIHDQGSSNLKSIYHFLEPEFWGENMADADESADVWSLGVLLYVMVCGCYPYPGDNAYDIFLSIKRGRMKFRDDLSDSCANLIRNMLHARTKRLTLEQVKQHNWVMGTFHPPASNNTPLDVIPEDFGLQGTDLQFNLQQKMNLQTPPVTPNGQFVPPNPFAQAQPFDDSPVILDNYTGEFLPFDFMDPKVFVQNESSPASTFDPYASDLNNNTFTSLPQASMRPEIRGYRKRSMDDVTLRSHMAQIESQQTNSSEPRPDFRRQTIDVNSPATVSLPESPRPTKKSNSNTSQSTKDDNPIQKTKPSAKKQLSFDDSSAFHRAANQSMASSLSNNAGGKGLIANSQPLANSLDSAFTPLRRQTVSSFSPPKLEIGDQEQASSLNSQFNLGPMRRSFSHSGTELYGNDRPFIAPTNQPPMGFPHYSDAHPIIQITVDELGAPLANKGPQLPSNKVDALKRALGNHKGRMTDLNTHQEEQKRMNQQQQVMMANAAHNPAARSQSPSLYQNTLKGNIMGGYGMVPAPQPGFQSPIYMSGIPPPHLRMHPVPPQSFGTPNHVANEIFLNSLVQSQQQVQQQLPPPPPQLAQLPSQVPQVNSNTQQPIPFFNGNDPLNLDFTLSEYDIANNLSFSEWLANDDSQLK
eukprot:TRINITY_DN4388_c0_g1_i1.p1 TRINITY_DN4388_c0_g1~~TRINITY_DN4388_c0_g1_i1.p1  ORF type:complete len:795 (-),score=225.57 TRINITY_DN4388_c0_g1_i1:92-2476(-)